MTSLPFHLYAIKLDGDYFCGKAMWSTDLSDAKFYSTLGAARIVVSQYYNGKNVPDIVQLTITDATILDETGRVEKAKRTRAARITRSEISHRQHEVKRLEEQIAKAKEELERINP